MQVPKRDSGKLPPCARGGQVPPEGRVFSPGSFLQAVVEVCSDSDLNFELQREGDSWP